MSPGARLWWVRPEAVQEGPATLALLDENERASQQRFIPPWKRHEYFVTRVLVRTVLGEALGVAPESVRFKLNQWGRPELGEPHSQLRFNLTHTQGLVMCLLSWEHEVGVDTELLSRAPRLLALAPRVFAPRELSDLWALPEELRSERAVVLWTLKESYIKARGMGLALALDGFAFHFEAAETRLEVTPALGDDGGRWQFRSWALGAHQVSVAIAFPPTEQVSLEVVEATLD